MLQLSALESKGLHQCRIRLLQSMLPARGKVGVKVSNDTVLLESSTVTTNRRFSWVSCLERVGLGTVSRFYDLKYICIMCHTVQSSVATVTSSRLRNTPVVRSSLFILPIDPFKVLQKPALLEANVISVGQDIRWLHGD